MSEQNINQVDLREEMQRSYLDYAMSVIIGRALPDVRDGLKPVHRRVLYAMYKGGYRPEKAFSKCARVVGDVMGQFHPHGDAAIYDALVRLVQPWAMRYPLAQGQGNFGSPGNDGAAAPRYTETKMATLAIEMVRDIDEDTVDFSPNYDGESVEPTVMPCRFPNLLVNGSVGIAVGMATNIPPHNLAEVSAGALWCLENPDATDEELTEALLERIKGPDFPTGATVLDTGGIKDAYLTGRGSVVMRGVVDIEEIDGRTCLVVRELPYQVNPDNLALKIASLVKENKLSGIADIRDETSGRTGQRLIIVLKRDAVARVVLNSLYKHTQLQENFGVNMLAIVDGAPRTLSLCSFIRLWVEHQIEVIVRRTTFRLARAEQRAHILRAYLKALDQIDAVIQLIRSSKSAEEAQSNLMALLKIDETQARAILDLQLRRLAALERQRIISEAREIEELISSFRKILSDKTAQCQVIAEELREIGQKHSDARRTEIIRGFDGSVSIEDLIPVEPVVVVMTRCGYIKRTRIDQYRSQHRGGRGVKGAQVKADDVVLQFISTTTHNWLMFFTNTGRVYRAKAYEVPEASREARGQHVANLLPLKPNEAVTRILSVSNFDSEDTSLVLATKDGYVKKTTLKEYDTSLSTGVIAIKLRPGDKLVSAVLARSDQDIILVTKNARSLRFKSGTLRPLSRGSYGVKGISLRENDLLLSAELILSDDSYIFVVSERGYAKRSRVGDYKLQTRGGIGVRVANITEQKGVLADTLVVNDDDEVLVILASGKVIRSSVAEVSPTLRYTTGVVFVRMSDGDKILAMTIAEKCDDLEGQG